LTTGARDAVLPGLTGLLVPPGDPRTLAESMLRLLRHPRRRVAMGRAARRWVVQQFIDTRVLGLTIALYKELLHDAETEAIGALVKGVAAVAD
jgi:glycosyltransferase involved in cell wall biosynthesis